MKSAPFKALSALAVLASLTFAPEARAQSDDIEWRHYGGDHSSARYSTASQIDRDNAKGLEIAWRFNAADADALALTKDKKSRNMVATPLMVGGRLYITTGLVMVVCLEPDTGKIIWTFDPQAYNQPGGPHGGLRSRGVEYWTDGEEERIIVATGGLQLIALDAKTGKQIISFGEEEGGWTDLSKGLGRDYTRREFGVNAPPVVCRDTIVVGSIINDFPRSKDMPPGHVRGYDVRTGKMKWIFHSIPEPGEFGNETWENDSWTYTGNTNVWSMMSADHELGYVYLPFGTPTNDHYGGHRHGDNLFAESLVCLDAETGKRVWHYQAVHHGIWDYDFPCAPNLLDIEVDGKKIKAVAQVSKQAFTYVFDRVTGEPVWPIEERPVPASKVPGEKAAPTQPFPTKPPAFDWQGVTEETLIDFTPEIKAEAIKIANEWEIGGLFTPPIAGGQEGKHGLIQLPGMTGGANWPGAAVDPETGILYVLSYTNPGTMALAEGSQQRSDFDFTRGRMASVSGPQGLPLIKPPWGRITAIDLNKGDFAWQIPHGDSYQNHPVVKELKLGPLGSSYVAGLAGPGTLVTKTLVFATQAKSGGSGYLRAFDKATGATLAEIEFDAAPVAPPMTYQFKGKQYIAFATKGGKNLEMMAFALP